MTFEEWQSKREWNTNASKDLNPDTMYINPGFQYPDGSIILLGYAISNYWYTIIGRDEIENIDLATVEKFLWENHSKDNVS